MLTLFLLIEVHLVELVLARDGKVPTSSHTVRKDSKPSPNKQKKRKQKDNFLSRIIYFLIQKMIKLSASVTLIFDFTSLFFQKNKRHISLAFFYHLHQDTLIESRP